MLFNFGNAVVCSLLAGGALALPRAQSNPVPNTETLANNGKPTEEVKSQPVPEKVGENTPLPEVSTVGPAYSLLLAKEVSPTDLDGVIVSWVYGNPFCTQRQLVSNSIEDFCNRNLTFDRVPKLDQNLQLTGEVTQISGYFEGCSDDVSLGRSYADLYWVEVVGMHDGVGDEPASGGGNSAPPPTQEGGSSPTNTGSGGSNTGPGTGGTGGSNTGPGTGGTGTSNTGSGTGTSNTGPGTGTSNTGTGTGHTAKPPSKRDAPKQEDEETAKAFRCNGDRESHGCPRSSTSEIDLISFASCGQYAYTDTSGGSGTGGTSGGSTTTPQQETTQEKTPEQQSPQ